MISCTFELTEAQAIFVASAATTGNYVDGSDYVRDLLRRDMARSAVIDIGMSNDIDDGCVPVDAESIVQTWEITRLQGILQNPPIVMIDKSVQYESGISATRLGSPDVQQQVLYDQLGPTVIQIHNMPALVFLPKALQIDVDPDVETIALSRLTTAPGGVLESMGMSSKVHPLTKHGKVVGGLVAYEDAERVLRDKGCDLWLV